MSGHESHLSDAVLDRLVEHVAGVESSIAHTDELMALASAEDLHAFEVAAGALACAFAADMVEPIPATLRHRCAGAAKAVMEPAVEPTQKPSPPERPSLSFTSHVKQGRPASGLPLGWIAAAACLMLAVVSWWPSSGAIGRGAGAVASVTPEVGLARLIETASDLDRWDWEPWGASSEGVRGEVVWSEVNQEGYMVLTGLPANDPAEEQYQLWVVESSRGTPLQVPPVDGGVFNVGDSGEVIVPVRCAIPARGVVAFAITREDSGGVVVSDQSRKVVIAQAAPES